MDVNIGNLHPTLSNIYDLAAALSGESGLKVTFYWGPMFSDPTGHEELLGEEQGSSTSRTRRTCNVTNEPPIGRLVIGKAEPERSPDSYRKGALNVASDSIVEQLLPASLDSALGSKMLALSEALTATTKQTIDLPSTASMGFVNYCRVCFDRRLSTMKCALIADADAVMCKRNANICEHRLGNKTNLGYSRSSKRNWNPKRIIVGRRHRQKQTAPSTLPWRLNSLIKVYVLVLLRWNRHCRLPPSHSHQEMAGKTNEGRLQEGILKKSSRAFHLATMPLSINHEEHSSASRQNPSHSRPTLSTTVENVDETIEMLEYRLSSGNSTVDNVNSAD